ncbi:MAG: tetratricopeptide repeat protein [Gammaproteobacteria bacterium]|nr:tetratricopeptide repeat protein [Gammaproteobacteria bacterium]
MTSAIHNTAQHSVRRSGINSGTCPNKLNVWKSLFIGLSLGAAAMSVQADAYEDGLMAYAIGNYTEAQQAFAQAADAGNTGAEHMLMRLFSENKIYAKNVDQETLKWTRKAAEKGVMQAQYALADIYAEKQGDAKAAVEWYRKAAEQGHAEAYYKLGGLYERGAEGVKADAQESVRLYQIAASEMDVFAQKGSADAQHVLAGMYQQGQGVKKDVAMALRWWEKAALQGHALAQLSLGRLYAQGEDGVQRDTHQATFWLNLAAAQGEPGAVALLDEMQAGERTRIALAM